MSVTILRPMSMDDEGFPKVGMGSTKLGVRECEIVCNKSGHATDADGPSVVLSFAGLFRLPPYLHPFVPGLIPLQRRTDNLHGVEPFSFTHPESGQLRVGARLCDGLKLMPKQIKSRGFLAPTDPTPPAVFRSTVEGTKKRWTALSWKIVAEQIENLEGY